MATFDRGTFTLLPLVLELLNKMHAGQDSAEVGRMSVQLFARFSECQALLERLPGLELTPEEQRAQMNEALAQRAAQLERLDAFRGMPALVRASESAEPDDSAMMS